MQQIELHPEETALLNKCISFIKELGIEVSYTDQEEESFLPGISISSGNLIINKAMLLYPGDILHEAGHIALVPAAERALLNADAIAARSNNDAEEIGAIAWSYAAAVHLNIDPAFVFHKNGYKGGSANLLESFADKRYIGLPLLQWMGLALDEKNAAEQGKDAYPVMIKWLWD